MIPSTKIIFLLTRAWSYRKAMSEEIVTERETFYWSIYDSRWQLQTSVSALRRNRTSGRFSNFRGLSASVSFSPLSLPSLSFFGLALIFARPKQWNLHGNPTETLATQAKEDMASCPRAFRKPKSAEEEKNLIENAIPLSTRAVTKWSVKFFLEWQNGRN